MQIEMSMMLQVQGVRPIWWGRRPSSRWLQIGTVVVGSIIFCLGWFGVVCGGVWCIGSCWI